MIQNWTISTPIPVYLHQELQTKFQPNNHISLSVEASKIMWMILNMYIEIHLDETLFKLLCIFLYHCFVLFFVTLRYSI